MTALWNRVSGPIKVGLIVGILAALLALFGWFREGFPDPLALLIVLVVGAGTWGVVAWAIAEAVRGVEEDKSP